MNAGSKSFVPLTVQENQGKWNCMGLNNTPNSERVHIALFGKRNAGKSSVINALTGQELAVVSEQKGTTTDPVQKAMELLPLGPVVMIDTPGLDDEGELGALRVQKAVQVLNKADIALLISDITEPFSAFEEELLRSIRERNLPHLIVLNKTDLYQGSPAGLIAGLEQSTGSKVIAVSTENGKGIHELKEALAGLVPKEEPRRLVGDLLRPLDLVVLVIPIDSAAPKGRLILPQQQAVRDILESDAVAVAVKDTELKDTLQKLGQKPRLVITDSQVFERVSRDVPEDVPLTSFSILFARHKGRLKELVQGANTVASLRDGDTILISEGCTHHRQCDDIGTVKIPKWLKQHTGKDLQFETTSGTEFRQDLSKYKLVVHCGGCMLNQREMHYRIDCSVRQGVPIVNYGVLIACMNGILKRSLEPFADIMAIED